MTKRKVRKHLLDGKTVYTPDGFWAVSSIVREGDLVQTALQCFRGKKCSCYSEYSSFKEFWKREGYLYKGRCTVTA